MMLLRITIPDDKCGNCVISGEDVFEWSNRFLKCKATERCVVVGLDDERFRGSVKFRVLMSQKIEDDGRVMRRVRVCSTRCRE